MELKTKEIPIKWKGNDAKVKIKQLSFKDITEIKDICVKKDGTPKQGKMIWETTIRGIVDAPFETSVEGLENVDSKMLLKIWKQIDEMSSIDLKKKDNS